MGIFLFRWNCLSTLYRIYTAAPFPHASPAKRVAGESEEQRSERTGDFSKKSPQAMCSLRRTGGAGGIPFPAGNATAVAARHWRPAKSRLSNPTRIKKHPSFDGCLLAERVGFEPTDGFTRQTISSRSRYDLFDTAPYGFAL